MTGKRNEEMSTVGRNIYGMAGLHDVEVDFTGSTGIFGAPQAYGPFIRLCEGLWRVNADAWHYGATVIRSFRSNKIAVAL